MKIDWKKWEKRWNRPIGLNQGEFYGWSCLDGIKRVSGLGLNSQLFVFKGKSVDGYFLKRELSRFDRYARSKYFNNKNLLKSLNKDILKYAKRMELFFSNLKEKDFSVFTSRELIKVYSASFRNLSANYGSLWVGFLLDDIADVKISKIIRKYGLPYEKTLALASGLEKPHHIIQEQLDLMRIVLNGGGIASVKKHQVKYSYIPCYSPEIAPYDLAYFKNKIKTTKKTAARKFLQKTKKGFAENHKAFQELLKNTDFSEAERIFVEYFHESAFLRDYRSHFRSLAMYVHRRIFEEIARRYGLELEQVVMLFNRELILLLRSNKISQEIKASLMERQNRDFVYLFANGRNIMLGKYKENVNNKLGIEIKGISVNKGMASGPVKIVLTPTDIGKVKTGDVLVSSMTRPDYVSVMRKVAAIITDEGGLLCHAAIVSREINKPCIVGTMNATSLLKDGDLVEVNANTGKITKK